MTFTKKESEEAKNELRTLLDDYKTSTVFVVQRHVSQSGMQRQLDLYVIPHSDVINPERFDGQIEPRRITYTVAQALQWTYSQKYEAITVNGCGMDMHFHTVYSLSCTLYCGDTYDHDSAYRLKHRTI